MAKEDTSLMARSVARDPFSLLRQMTAEFDRAFGSSAWPRWSTLDWPTLRAEEAIAPTWAPGIDVVQKDNRLVTRVDLPGMKKDDVKVEVTDGHLTISGERKKETEEKKDQFYRREREYGSFYRAVPLPEGVTLDDVKATFVDGVLEVSVPLPTRPEPKKRTVHIQESTSAA